jgi:biopolymer transport protein TolR
MRFYVKRKRTPQIIIVSLIDIFAILLIFFIVTTTFKTAQTQLAIKLPESKSATQSQTPAEPVFVEVNKEEKLQFDGKVVGSLDELKSALQQFESKATDRPIAMKADADVPFGFMVQILDTFKDAGVKSVPALTRPKEQK